MAGEVVLLERCCLFGFFDDIDDDEGGNTR
jgi:hypothetical protein